MSMTKKILVLDVMLDLSSIPVASEKKLLKEALEEMSSYGLGITCIVDGDRKLLGVLTDGDIRRKLLKIQKPFSAFFVDDVLEHAVKNPIVVGPTETLAAALSLMEAKKIWDLPVVNQENQLIGLLHLHHTVKVLLRGI
jgi:DeoR family transcriptional regulator, catabolite repression regulator